MAKLSLRLYIDVEKNEVLLAEADRDFVDTLFSVLTLPVGTIVRMLKKRDKESLSRFVGCLNNLYTSVEDIRVENFSFAQCKEMLLYPRSVKDDHCSKLKLNVNDTLPLESFSGDSANGVFVSGRASFIITKDMNVSRCSPGLLLKALGGLGCADVNKLDEMRIDVGAEEVLTFIECLLSSDSPLTDAFLKKQSPVLSEKMHTVATPVLSEKPGVVVPGETITLNVIMRKVDRKILYVECEKDFIELLFTFLVVPFEYLLEVSTDQTVAKCVSNFVKSYRELRCREGTDGSTSHYELPWYYHCQKQLLDVTCLLYRGGGFVKEGLKFMVTDDLFCTPLHLHSSLSYLKKKRIHLDDIDEQVISIGKLEAKRLLGASLKTSSVLSTALGNLRKKCSSELP